MSEALPNIDDLSKLKLSELKKICKENKISPSGTKTELISRITEMHGNKFVILQPGDEAELLGDNDDGDSNDVSMSHSSELNCSKTTSDTLDFPIVSATKSTGLKRPASDLLTSEDIPMKSETSIESLPIVEDKHSDCKDGTLSLSDSERIILRAKRFKGENLDKVNILTDDKLIARAKRFGLPIDDVNVQYSKNGTKIDELEKLKRRAERFGQTTSKTLEKLTDLERKVKRLEKFGETDISLLIKKTHVNDEFTKLIRAKKFNLPISENNLSESDKLSKRQIRFGLVDSKT
ncbi:unnamed protein product [Heterobilharzia americana]|nr:unnamed protein product [Heterobilharzia americana]